MHRQMSSLQHAAMQLGRCERASAFHFVCVHACIVCATITGRVWIPVVSVCLPVCVGLYLHATQPAHMALAASTPADARAWSNKPEQLGAWYIAEEMGAESVMHKCLDGGINK